MVTFVSTDDYLYSIDSHVSRVGNSNLRPTRSCLLCRFLVYNITFYPILSAPHLEKRAHYSRKRYTKGSRRAFFSTIIPSDQYTVISYWKTGNKRLFLWLLWMSVQRSNKDWFFFSFGFFVVFLFKLCLQLPIYIRHSKSKKSQNMACSLNLFFCFRAEMFESEIILYFSKKWNKS